MIKPQAAFPYGWIFLACVGVVAVFAVYGTHDIEEMNSSMLATQLFAQMWRADQLSWWTTLMGFGAPLPLTQSQHFHPAFAALPYLGARAWLNLFYLTALFIGGVGVYLILRHVGAAARFATLAAVSFLYSSAIVEYAFWDFWPTHVAMITFAPYVILGITGLAGAQTQRNRLFWTLFLGAASGLFVLNGHFGVIPQFTVGFLLYAVAVSGRNGQTYRWLVVAAVLGALIGAAHVWALLSEYAIFDQYGDVVARSVKDPLPLGLHQILTVVRFLLNIHLHPDGFIFFQFDQRYRLIFFGAPLALLAMTALVWRGAPHAQRFAWLFLAACVAIFTPSDGVVVSSPLHSRDLAVLFGCLAGGALLHHWAARGTLSERWVRVIIGLQLAALAAAFLPTPWALSRGAEDVVTLRELERDSTLDAALWRATAERPGMRIALDGELEAWLRGNQDILAQSSLMTISFPERQRALATGSLKGGSLSLFDASPSFPYGTIGFDEGEAQDADLLAFYAIDVLAALDGAPVAPTLTLLDRVTVADRVVAIYRNTATQLAFFSDDAQWDQPLPVKPGCAHDRLMCRNYTQAMRHRQAAPVTSEFNPSQYRLRFAAAEAPRQLVVATPARDGWRVVDQTGSPLATQPVYGGLLGIQVPAGTTQANLVYKPTVIIALTTLSASLLVALAALLIMMAWRRSRAES
ncbi:hypothetical protein [Magnetofaba australis]|uniref:Putative membrane protein n=1 Tax=Magnetofaba australis IT-1 TaxID=1434232 RepID=A0A1Y2K386_9PROT|nr:hypothetical protein [Magnetofaba australis]OSM02419.1 putative membrane protein [Magnetofaba australis IT-1]